MTQSTQWFLLAGMLEIKCLNKDFQRMKGFLECKNKVQCILIICAGTLNPKSYNQSTLIQIISQAFITDKIETLLYNLIKDI